MATSQRLLGVAILALLVAAIVTAVVKGPGDDELTIGPTESPTPTQTFTFPGPVPTETPMFPTPEPTETEPAPGETPDGEELPRTGGGSAALPTALTLALAAGGGFAVLRAARGDPEKRR